MTLLAMSLRQNRQPRTRTGSGLFRVLELCRRYSNRDDLLKPLAAVLRLIETGDQTNEPGICSAPREFQRLLNDRLTKADIAGMIERFKEGATLKQVANEFGICVKSVQRVLLDHGVGRHDHYGSSSH